MLDQARLWRAVDALCGVAVLVAWALCFGAGCGDSSDTPSVGTTGTTGTTGAECASASDCGEGQACEAGVCVDENSGGCGSGPACGEGQTCVGNVCVNANNAQPCADDAACEAGAICEAGGCRPGCREDAQCPDGERCDEVGLVCVAGERACDPPCGDGTQCDTSRGVCDPRIPCTSTIDCSPGFFCIASGVCDDRCESDDDCIDGASCAGGACVASACVEDAACEDGEICEDGDCVAGCRDDDGCDAGFVCAEGACVPDDAECRDDEGCDEGSICDAGACRPGCRRNAECPSGFVCSETACVEGCRNDRGCGDGEICEGIACVPGCRDDAGCGDGEICADGACAVGCRDDASCGVGAICEDSACVAGCRDDAACGDGEICADGACVVGCREDDVCGQGRICDAQACREGCRDDDGCGVGTICADTRCVAGCRDDAACGQGRICEGDACVAGCRGDAGCGVGEICEADVCVAGCRDDDGCDTGQACVDTVCVCQEDDAEPNQNADEATALELVEGAAQRDGALCGVNRDWFAVELDAGCAWTATLYFEHARGDLNMAVYGANRIRLATAASGDDNEVLEGLTDASGPLYFEVVPANVDNDNAYRLELAVDCAPPPACEDDAQEDDDTLGQANLLGAGPETSSGRICGLDPDLYALELGAGCSATAAITYDAAGAELDAFLLDEVGAFLVEARDNGQPGAKSLGYRSRFGGRFYVRVEASDAADQNDYTLDTEVDCALGCFNDAEEPNDTVDDATPLDRVDQEFGAICPDDTDVFQVYALEGCTIQAQLEFTHALGDLQLELRAPDGGPAIASSATELDREELAHVTGFTGEHTLHVTRASDQTDPTEFRVAVDVVCPTELVCPADDIYEDNDVPSEPAVAPLDAQFEAIACGQDEDAYAIPAEAGCTLDVNVRFNDRDGNLNARLYDPDLNVIAASASSDDDEDFSVFTETEGVYVLLVFAFLNPGNVYHVDVNVDCSPLVCEEDAFEENDTLAEAVVLADGGELVEGVMCGLDPDVYAVQAEPGCVVLADLSFAHDDGDLSLSLYDPDGVLIAESRSSDDDERLEVEALVSGLYSAEVTLGTRRAVPYTLDLAAVECPADDPRRVVLSEVLYDPTGAEAGRQWVELYNAGDVPVDLTTWSLGYGGASYASGVYPLDGVILPGECRVVGGPTSDAGNSAPSFDQAVAFEPPLDVGGTISDGIALFRVPAEDITPSRLPFDAVVYDNPNISRLIGPDGEARIPADVSDAPEGQSIERTADGWRIQPTPTPGDCSPFVP